MAQRSDTLDPGLCVLARLAGLQQLAADAAQLNHEFGRADRPCGDTELLAAARCLGLKARIVEVDFERLAKLPLPAIARLNDASYVLVGAVRDDHVLLQRAAGGVPECLDRALFEAQWSGAVLLASRRAAITLAARRFDFCWFVPFILKHRRLLGEVLLASAFLQVFALVTPIFFQLVIDKVLVHQGLTTLDILALGLLLVSVFEVVLGGLRAYLFAHTSNRIDIALGAALFAHLLRLPLAYFEARRVGDTVARVRELETIRSLLTGAALTVAVDAVFTLLLFLMLYLYSPALCLLVAATLPFYAALALGVSPALRARLEHKFSAGADSQAFLVEAVSGIQTLKAAAVEPATRRLWEERLAVYVEASFRAGHLANITNQGAALVNKLMVLGILWWGAHRVMAGALSVGELVAFNMLAARVSGPLLRVLQLWQDYQQAGVSVRRLGDILNAVPEPTRQPSGSALPPLRGRVALEHVSFRYRSDGPLVLHDLSLAVEPGTVLGIVGPSGSGKSTLTKLVQRLYVPEAGRIRVDGVDLATIDSAWLRRRVGVVLQENMLFNRSVRENIALVDPALPMARVRRAAELAGAHDFIADLPQAYDTPVGEHGATLSGGQRQRIAIARALITDPRILILDEATSALDYESEAIIQRNMRDICAGRTVLIIAHRLSAVRIADRLLVIDQGRIVAQGTHAELLAQGGYYSKMVRQQTDVGRGGPDRADRARPVRTYE